MTLTTRSQMAVALLAGAVVGYLLVGGFDLSNKAVPITPWSLPTMLAALALAAFGYSRVLAHQLRTDRASLDPMAGVRAVVFGKTLLMTGLVTAGGHLVYALRFSGGWQVEGPRQRIIRGAVVCVVSLLLAGAGWVLERACVAPGSGKGEDADDDIR